MRLILPSRFTRQTASVTINKQKVFSPLALYNGAVGAIDLVSGKQLAQASAFKTGTCAAGKGSVQDNYDTGLSLSGQVYPSLSTYVVVWSGVFLGASDGNTPKLVGIASSSTSQSLDLIGLELDSATDFRINFKSSTTNSNRTFTGSIPAANTPTTVVAVYDELTEEVRLHVCSNGAVTSYSSAVASAASPTILGTEVFVVGPDVVEGPSRFCNVVTTLAGVFQSVGGPYNEMALARNPWMIFNAERPLKVSTDATAATDTAGTTSQGQTAVAAASVSTAGAGTTSQGQTAVAAASVSTAGAGTASQGQTAVAAASVSTAGAGTASQGQTVLAIMGDVVNVAGSVAQSQTATAAGAIAITCMASTKQGQKIVGVLGDITPDGVIPPDEDWLTFIVSTQQSELVVKFDAPNAYIVQ